MAEAYGIQIRYRWYGAVQYVEMLYIQKQKRTDGTIAAMRELYMRSGQGFLLVFSITSLSSLTELHELRDQIVRIKDDAQVPLVIVGNKSDLEDERVSAKVGATYIITRPARGEEQTSTKHLWTSAGRSSAKTQQLPPYGKWRGGQEGRGIGQVIGIDSTTTTGGVGADERNDRQESFVPFYDEVTEIHT
ncbi:MAG: hypothetical protein Q9188_004981 [Gyalolechia gomerana]